MKTHQKQGKRRGGDPGGTKGPQTPSLFLCFSLVFLGVLRFLLAFFDFPGLDLGPYREVLGSMHHLAISVAPDKHLHLKSKLKAAGVKIVFEHGNSFYFNGPDGERLELLAEPLGQMNGRAVL